MIEFLLFLSFVQEAERKVKNMEEEICRLQTRLEESNGQLRASSSSVEKVPPPKLPLFFFSFIRFCWFHFGLSML